MQFEVPTRSLGASIAVACLVAVAACDSGPCPSPQINCHYVCVDLRNDRDNCGICGGSCAMGDTCAAGKCVVPACPTGRTLCGDGGCVDFTSNASNCGACGTACASGTTCSGGVCVKMGCANGLVDCGGGNCKDLANDAQNCGGCGGACPAATVCVAGQCVGCPATFTYCNGACVDATNDPANCGGCGRSCPTPYCVGGICQ